MLFWCVMVLVVLNVATLGSFWLLKPPRPSPKGIQERPDGQRIMEEQLRLSPEQADDFERIREQHFMRTRPLQDKMHRIRLDVLDEIFAPEPDDNKILEMLAELGNLQYQFEDNLYEHFRELKMTCTEQQAEDLKIMLRDLIERTRPRDPQGHPGSPEGQRHPRHRPPPMM